MKEERGTVREVVTTNINPTRFHVLRKVKVEIRATHEGSFIVSFGDSNKELLRAHIEVRDGEPGRKGSATADVHSPIPLRGVGHARQDCGRWLQLVKRSIVVDPCRPIGRKRRLFESEHIQFLFPFIATVQTPPSNYVLPFSSTERLLLAMSRLVLQNTPFSAFENCGLGQLRLDIDLPGYEV